MPCRTPLQLIAVIALSTSSFAATLTYVRLDEPIVEGRLALKPVDQAARLTMLRNQFLKAGCTADQIKEQPVPGQDQPNLICTLPGTEPGSIVIAANSDYQSKGDEAKVDWATLSMLPMLAESLYKAPRRYSLVFVAFTGHKNLEGSEAYLKGLADEEKKIYFARWWTCIRSAARRRRTLLPPYSPLRVCRPSASIRRSRTMTRR